MEQLIVEFDDARGLYVHSRAAGRFPMHDTAQRLTKLRLQRHHKTLIANGHNGILHHTAVCRHEVLERTMHTVADLLQALANMLEGRTSLVTHIALIV